MSVVPHVVVVAGGSMEPTLPAGCWVRVRPLDNHARPGAIILIRSPAGYVIHRVIWTATFRDGWRVFHRGDAEGRIGLAAERDVLGQAVARLDSPERRPNELDTPTARGWRRRLERAQLRCRLYASARRAVEVSGLTQSRFTRRAARLLAAWLL